LESELGGGPVQSIECLTAPTMVFVAIFSLDSICLNAYTPDVASGPLLFNTAPFRKSCDQTPIPPSDRAFFWFRKSLAFVYNIITVVHHSPVLKPNGSRPEKLGGDMVGN